MSILKNKSYVILYAAAVIMLSACSLSGSKETAVNNIAGNMAETQGCSSGRTPEQKETAEIFEASETTGCWEVMSPPEIMEFTEAGTIQEAVSDETNPEDAARRLLNTMTLEQKVLQMFIVTPEAITEINPVTVIDDDIEAALNKYPVGGFILFSKNIVSPQQLKSMLARLNEAYGASGNIPPFLCIDEEGGTVARLANTKVLSIENVGNMCDIKDEEAAYDAGSHIGGYLSEYGFNVDFAPVADVSADENNTMKYRSFGSDPQEVSGKIQAFEKGLQSFGVLPVLKHFPGIGSSAGDTHTGYDVINKTLEELVSTDLIPFIDGINSGADIIMVSHISAPYLTGDSVPCSLSASAVNGFLRTELGFGGIVITDAMNMQAVSGYYASDEAAVLAIEAGADIILMPEDFETAYAGVLKAAEAGRLDVERIDESVYRILKVKLDIK